MGRELGELHGPLLGKRVRLGKGLGVGLRLGSSRACRQRGFTAVAGQLRVGLADG